MHAVGGRASIRRAASRRWARDAVLVRPPTNRCVQSGNTTFIPDLAAYSFLSGKLSDIRSAEDPCPATIARASGRDEKLRVEWRNQPCICTLH